MNKNAVQTKYRFLTGNVLKWAAVVSMVIDHIAAVVLKGCVNMRLSSYTAAQLERLNAVYMGMRHIGRTAFPLFAFLLAEGFFHTKNRKRYGMRLLCFAVLSEIPYDLAFHGQIWYGAAQNTLFALFLGLLLMAAAERIRDGCVWKGRNGRLYVPTDGVRILLQGLVFVAGGGLAYVCRLDYTYKGIALIAVFYFFFGYRALAAFAGFCVFSWNFWSFPAFLMIPFYNGKRSAGQRGGRDARSARGFYLFYPLHLLALYGLVLLLQIAMAG